MASFILNVLLFFVYLNNRTPHDVLARKRKYLKNIYTYFDKFRWIYTKIKKNSFLRKRIKFIFWKRGSLNYIKIYVENCIKNVYKNICVVSCGLSRPIHLDARFLETFKIYSTNIRYFFTHLFHLLRTVEF